MSFDASASGAPFPEVSSTLPQEVVNCLKNARFLHLGTCANNTPHVSLMNYTYLQSTPFQSTPSIILTMYPGSKKTSNLVDNPLVSLLVHDWISHRPPNAVNSARDGSPPEPALRSSLANMLLNMNTTALSRISTTINGEARLLESGSEEESWCKKMHLENNTFGEPTTPGVDLFGTSPGFLLPGETSAGDGGRTCFIADEEVRVVVVTIKDGRIADWKGAVRDWIVIADGQPAVNGEV